jgi:hypothetical protein
VPQAGTGGVVIGVARISPAEPEKPLVLKVEKFIDLPQV